MDILEIHELYYNRVKGFILSVVKDVWVAEDLVQEAFIKIKNNIGSLKDQSKLSSWIFRIAWNLCQDHFKSRALKNKKNTDMLQEHVSEVQIHKTMERNQMGACVQEKMNRLPDTLRIPLILFDIQGFNHSEIAEVLNISVENAKVRLHRARKELKEILSKECTFERDERDVFVCVPVGDHVREGG